MNYKLSEVLTSVSMFGVNVKYNCHLIKSNLIYLAKDDLELSSSWRYKEIIKLLDDIIEALS